jgi:formate dehydrogenase maturation protein FdhE
VHSAEAVPHVRVDECATCRRYLKTVDLRRRGDAVPLVEDLATPELDLWAREQGLAKGQANLFGL